MQMTTPTHPTHATNGTTAGGLAATSSGCANRKQSNELKAKVRQPLQPNKAILNQTTATTMPRKQAATPKSQPASRVTKTGSLPTKQ